MKKRSVVKPKKIMSIFILRHFTFQNYFPFQRLTYQLTKNSGAVIINKLYTKRFFTCKDKKIEKELLVKMFCW